MRSNRAGFCASLLKRVHFLFPDKLYLALLYRLEIGKWIDWKNPNTFTEKLQWLKVYDFKPEYTKMVDKYAVKDYVASIIGEQYIIPTLGVWDRVEDIDWDSLPEQFVLKTTHGGGGGGVVICSDKSKFDRKAAEKKLSASMRENAGKTLREKPYIKVPRRIIAEKYMAEREQNELIKVKDLPDYKFYCFAGQPKYCQVIRDRHTKETIDFYDMEWNHMPFVGINPVARNGLTPVARPVNLETMKEICCKLSKDMKFSRIDLYEVNDKEYFGEITLYPASGFGEFTPNEWNEKLGELISLEGTPVGGGNLIKINKDDINVIPISKTASGVKELIDYKFYCFNGEPKLVMVADGRNSGNKRFGYYDVNWNPVKITWGAPRPEREFVKPSNLEEMLKVASELSKNLVHARIDLYNINNKVYFGEITFFDSSGLEPIEPEEYDKYLGSLMKLPKAVVGGGKILIINDKVVFCDSLNKETELKDYKFFCFGGKVKCFKVDYNRFVEHHLNYYNPQGKMLPFGEAEFKTDLNHTEVMPANLHEMVNIAEILSDGLKFVRVDLYNVTGKIYFGELTFYPSSGLVPFEPKEWDSILGSWIHC